MKFKLLINPIEAGINNEVRVGDKTYIIRFEYFTDYWGANVVFNDEIIYRTKVVSGIDIFSGLEPAKIYTIDAADINADWIKET